MNRYVSEVQGVKEEKRDPGTETAVETDITR